MKSSWHWYPSPCLKKDYKIGLLGNFGRMYGLLTSEACFFVYCVKQGTVDRRPALSLNKNASALVVTESEKG